MGRTLWSLFWLPFVLAYFGMTIVHRPVTWWLLVNFAAWPLVLLSTVAVHELAHATVGLLVGLKPRGIALGIGRELARFRVGALEVRVNTFPLLGLTFLLPLSTRWVRLRLWLAIAAGPAVTLGLVQLLLAFAPTQPISEMAFSLWNISSMFMVRELAILVNCMALFFNLMPVRLSNGRQTDGAALLTLPRMPQDRVEEWLAADLTLDAIEAPERHDLSLASRVAAEALERFPSSMAPLHLLALVELERGQYAEARARLSALIDDTRAHGVELVLKNNLAWVDFLTRDEALLAEADAFSMEVIDLLPNAPSALGTRGAVLFWRGDLEESCRHLERARLLASTPSSRALNACCLALAWSRRGDQERARRLLEEARRDDQRCLLLDEATMAVA